METTYAAGRQGLATYAPSPDVLAAYQVAALGLIVYDEDGEHIGERPPLEYMHDGIVEEFLEAWAGDPLHQDYDRAGVLLEGVRGFSAGTRAPLATELHGKEFGDISWYAVNRLTLQGLHLVEAVERGKCEYARRGAVSTLEDRLGGLLFGAYALQFIEASRQAIDRPAVENLQALSTHAGLLILSMAHIVAVRLNTDYAVILAGNAAKVARRTREGKLFDKAGGDAR